MFKWAESPTSVGDGFSWWPWGLAVDGWRNEDLAEYAALARTWMEDDDDVYEDVD